MKRVKALYIVVEFAITVLVIMGVMKVFNRQNRVIRRAWAKMQKYLIGYSLKTKGSPDSEAKMLLINHQIWLG